MKNRNGRAGHTFLLVLLVVSTILVALVVMPFVGALFAAAVFATVFQPAQARLSKAFGDRPKLSAATITLTLLLVVFVPLSIVVGVVGTQIAGAVSHSIETMRKSGPDGLVNELPEGLRPYARRVVDALPRLESQPDQKDENDSKNSVVGEEKETPPNSEPEKENPEEEEGGLSVGSEVAEAISDIDVGAVALTTAKATKSLLTRLIGLGIDAGVLLIAMFFLLVQGHSLVQWVTEVVPLRKHQTAQFVNELRDVTVAVFTSTVLTAFIQTGISAVGYLIAGTPMLMLVLLVTFVGAFVPAIGAAGFVIGVGLLTLAAGDTGAGVFLTLWGLIPVSLCDNVLKPMLAQGRLHLPGSVLFFAMLGGLALMGPMGVIAGPLIISFFIVVLRMLKERQDEGDEGFEAEATA